MFQRSILAALAILAVPIPALAANNYAVKDGNGQFILKCAIQQGDTSQADCSNELGLGFADAGKTPVSTTITAAGVSASFTPVAGRKFHMTIAAGTGSATCYMEAKIDGTNWYYTTVQGTPFSYVTYTGLPINESVTEAKVGVPYRWDCGGTYGSFTSGTLVLGIYQ